MHPDALRAGAVCILPSRTAFEAMKDAPDGDPVGGVPDNTWERYLVRPHNGDWALRFDGRHDDLPPSWEQ